MAKRRIDWAAWDTALAPVKDYILWLPNRISQENIDTLFSLLPEEYSDVSYDYDQGDLSKAAATHLFEFLPILPPYDYEIHFKASLARMTLRHRNRISFVFGFDDTCRINNDDRVGNAFMYAGNAKILTGSSGGAHWRAGLEDSVLNKLGKGFL